MWAKVLAFISGGAIVLGALGGAFGLSLARKLALDAVDPAYIASTLQRIGNFPDSATSGYHPVVALKLPRIVGVGEDLAGVIFDQGQGQMQFDLVSYESEDSDPDPKEVIDYCYDKPAVFRGLTAKFESIVDKGKVDISGHELVYQIVLLKEQKDLEDAKGTSYKGMIGCMTIGRKVIVVEAATPEGQPFDINVVLDFLRKAHSF